MVNTSDSPILVDGVRLDTLAWNISKLTRGTASRRATTVQVPGLDGAIPSYNDPLDQASMGLDMFVRGTDADGAVPVAGSRSTFWANLDELVHLFGKRHDLLEVREQTGPGTALTNYLSNPGFETNANTWAIRNGLASIARSTAQARTGTASLLATTNTGVNESSIRVDIRLVPTTPGEPWSAGGYLRAGTGTGRVGYVYLDWFNAAGGYIGSVISPSVALSTTGWTLVNSSGTAPPNTAYVSMFLGTASPSGVSGDTWYADDTYLQQTLTPAFFSGDTTADGTYLYAWTGTANASNSTRTPLTQRRAFAKVTDTLTPETNAPGSAGNFTVNLTIPSGCWEDAYLSDWASPTNPTGPQEVTTLRGATERTADAQIIVRGPINNPRLTDPATGAYVQLNKNLAAGNDWRLNLATWSSRSGAVLSGNQSYDTTDAAGTDESANTVYGGAQSVAQFLTLQPVRTPYDKTRRVTLTLTGTSGQTASTLFTVRARRKYAL